MSRELTREEKAAIRALVVKWCANYDRELMMLAFGLRVLYAGEVLDFKLLPLLPGGRPPP